MLKTAEKKRYRPTESQYKGGAEEMFVTYDRQQKTRGGENALYSKVKRVYIAGKVKGWKVSTFKTRTGRDVYGVLIEYEQSRKGYQREAYTAKRGRTAYEVSPATVKSSTQRFKKIVPVPREARNVQFHTDARQLANKYQTALQNVR